MRIRLRKSLAFCLGAALWALVSCVRPPAARSQALRAQAGAYELEVLVDGAPARSFVHGGESYVLGQEGSRYVLRVHNRSGRRIEAVASVDGLDVIDGKPADYASKRGYLVPAYGSVDIEGWRLSQREAAAFRFAAVSQSYAAKTGNARNVGVIGVAVFPERTRPIARVYVPAAPSYPSSGGDARREDRTSTSGKAAADAPSAPAASAPRAASSSDALAETSAAQAPARRERSGLGTEFGEAVSSQIREVEFVRAHVSRPSVVLGLRYNDRAGLYALGIDVDLESDGTDLALRQTAQPFPPPRRPYARPPADWRRD